MATIAEVAYSVRNQIKGYYSTDDERIDIELVVKKLWDLRAVLMKELYNKQGYLDISAYSTECCLLVECRELECDGRKSGDLEYYVKIPKINTSIGWDSVLYFGTIDKMCSFHRTSIQGYNYSKHSTYIRNAPTYTILDDEIILYNKPTLGGKYVCLIAILEEPEEYCNLEDPFPIPSHLIHKLELLAVQQFMSTLQLVPDESNNARNVPTPAPEFPPQQPTPQT